MTHEQIERLKATGWFKLFGPSIMRVYGIIQIRKQRSKFNWMTIQKNMVDPAETKRPKYWKKCGVDTTGNFKVGYGVYFDAGNASHIHIEDGVWIASECLFLCHRRILDDYKVGDDYNKLPYKKEDIYLKRGCCIGMRSTIMPGVTIGEGAIIGVGSLVTKDVPPYSVAVGQPAKIVKYFDKRTTEGGGKFLKPHSHEERSYYPQSTQLLSMARGKDKEKTTLSLDDKANAHG